MVVRQAFRPNHGHIATQPRGRTVTFLNGFRLGCGSKKITQAPRRKKLFSRLPAWAPMSKAHVAGLSSAKKLSGLSSSYSIVQHPLRRL